MLVVALFLVFAAIFVIRQNKRYPPKPRMNPAGSVLSVYTSAWAAGATVEGDSVDAVVRQLMDGVRGSGDFREMTFLVPELSSEEMDRVRRKLVVIDGVLMHRPAEGDSGPDTGSVHREPLREQ